MSSVEEEDREFPLRLTVEGYVLGEAEGEAEEEGEGFQVMAVDDITLTFCLPCDFDLLPQPGNLQLTAAPALTVALGNITTLLLSASSPLCPTLPLVFMIEAGETRIHIHYSIPLAYLQHNLYVCTYVYIAYSPIRMYVCMHISYVFCSGAS